MTVENQTGAPSAAGEARLVPSGVQLWRLSARGEGSLGLSCNDEGLFLGGTALVERRVRPLAELERLLMRAYGAEIAVRRLMPGFRTVAAALGERNLCLAQIAAVHLRMPDLSDEIARGSLETEDRLIKAGRAGDRLARAGWDSAEHPRAGGPPNPGWFAPTGGGEAPARVAQGEEDERAPEELLDPEAPVRQALWDARIATLRQIDPGNAQLSYVTAPGWVPSNQDIAAINAEIGQAATRRVTDFIMRKGRPIGVAGAGRDIRVVEGGATAAHKAFDYLSVGGTDVTPSAYPGTLIQLPQNAGYIGLRISDSGPAVDVNVPGVPYRTLHYP